MFFDEARFGDGEVLNKPTNDEYMVNGVILVGSFKAAQEEVDPYNNHRRAGDLGRC